MAYLCVGVAQVFPVHQLYKWLTLYGLKSPTFQYPQHSQCFGPQYCWMLTVALKYFHTMPLRDLLKSDCRAFLIIMVADNKKILPVAGECVKAKVREVLWCSMVTCTHNSASGISADHTGWVSAISKQSLFSNYSSHILSRLMFLTRSYSLGISIYFLNNVWRFDSALCWAQTPIAAVCKAPQMSTIRENEHKIGVILKIFAGFKEAHLVVVPSYIPLSLETHCATKTGLSLDVKELLTN